MFPMVCLIQEIYKFLLLEDFGSSYIWRECVNIHGMSSKGMSLFIANILCCFYYCLYALHIFPCVDDIEDVSVTLYYLLEYVLLPNDEDDDFVVIMSFMLLL